MARLLSTIRLVPGGDGPFYVVSERNGSVTNVTLGIATLAAGLDQAKTDQGADFVAPLVRVTIDTQDSG